MSDTGLPQEALDAVEEGALVNTGADNGFEDDVMDDQPQTHDSVEGAPA